MAVFLSPVGGAGAQFFDNSGYPLTGGKLYTYAAGTTTPETTYTTSSGNVAWTNPIVLDSAGRVSGSGEIWISDNTTYKFVLKTSTDVLIATYDDVISGASNDANEVNYDPPFTGGVVTTVENKLSQTISVQDFGAIPNNATSDQNAFTLAKDNGAAYTTPYGSYYLPSAFDSGNTPIISYGATFNLGSPATTYLRSFIDLGSKAILRKSIRDPSEYNGTPTTYTYVTDLTSIDIRHQNGAGYQQYYTSDSGGRTSIPAIYIEGSHFGYGDVPGVSVHYGISQHPNSASISGNWTGANSVVCFDGETVALTQRVNVYGAEFHLGDNGYDRVAAIGLVLSFDRENGNPSTGYGQYNTVWTGVRIQTEGPYPADSGFSVNGLWNVGLDFSGATLSNSAAIALKSNDRVYFGVPATSPPIWFANTLSDNYQTFDGTKHVFVANGVPSLQIGSTAITSSVQHTFTQSINIGSGYTYSSASAGSASALPGAPQTYVVISINGSPFKIPVYNL